MKKQIKRLSLHRETLRHLKINNLVLVVGGTDTTGCTEPNVTSMPCIYATECECYTIGPTFCCLPPH